MTKGIRQYMETRFAKLLPKLQDMGGTGFRRKLIEDTMTQFDITIASAAAAYNYVIQKMREENPRAVAGLGRTEQGLNVIAANAGRGAAGRRVANAGKRTAVAVPGNVTLMRLRDGETVVESIPRSLAQQLVDASGGKGRGNAKLVIKEDQEEEAEA